MLLKVKWLVSFKKAIHRWRWCHNASGGTERLIENDQKSGPCSHGRTGLCHGASLNVDFGVESFFNSVLPHVIVCIFEHGLWCGIIPQQWYHPSCHGASLSVDSGVESFLSVLPCRWQGSGVRTAACRWSSRSGTPPRSWGVRSPNTESSFPSSRNSIQRSANRPYSSQSQPIRGVHSVPKQEVKLLKLLVMCSLRPCLNCVCPFCLNPCN